MAKLCHSDSDSAAGFCAVMVITHVLHVRHWLQNVARTDNGEIHRIQKINKKLDHL